MAMHGLLGTAAAALIGGGLAASGMFRREATAFAAQPKPLRIPPLSTGQLSEGVRVFDLTLQRGVSSFFEGVRTPTLGINGAFLGPTLSLRDGETVRLNVTNRLDEPSTLHWHGLHLPARADGGPHQVVAPGTTWSPQFEVRQRAAMFWYHSHLLSRTGPQVYQGLAGLIYVSDDESAGSDLPGDYGTDDIPLVLQDRTFNSDGSLYYSSAMHNRMMGMQGDTLLVNGGTNPYLDTARSTLRLRILNGSNARFYDLGFSDGRSFHQIASDGGLLESPSRRQRLILAPGERAQIIVDVSDGRPAILRAYPPQSTFAMGPGRMGPGMMGRGMGPGMMGRGMMMMADDTVFDVLTIRPQEQRLSPVALSGQLVTLPHPDPSDVVNKRRFVLDMGMGGMMMGGGFTINGKAMDMSRIDEIVRAGTSEIWEIENASPMPHPFHVHDVQFRVLDRNEAPPHPGEQGLKDTVVVAPGERVRLLLHFADYRDRDAPYMYHCHVLEHEDAGMMGQFVVT